MALVLCPSPLPPTALVMRLFWSSIEGWGPFLHPLNWAWPVPSFAQWIIVAEGMLSRFQNQVLAGHALSLCPSEAGGVQVKSPGGQWGALKERT